MGIEQKKQIYFSCQINLIHTDTFYSFTTKDDISVTSCTETYSEKRMDRNVVYDSIAALHYYLLILYAKEDTRYVEL